MVQLNQIEAVATPFDQKTKFFSEQQMAQIELNSSIRIFLVALGKTYSIEFAQDDMVLEMLVLSSLRDIVHLNLEIEDEEFKQRAENRMLDYILNNPHSKTE